MHAVAGKKGALSILFFCILCAVPWGVKAQTVYVPPGWRAGRGPETVTIYNPRRTEGVSFRLIPYASKPAVKQLRDLVFSLKPHAPDLRYFAIRADRSGKMAECQLLYTGMDNTGKKPVKRHDRLLLVTSKANRKSLLVLSYAQAGIYSAARKNLDRIVNSAFNPPPATNSRRKRPRDRARVGPVDLSRIPLKTVNTGIYWIKVPSGWRVDLARDGNLQVESREGDRLFIYTIQVPADYQTYQNIAYGDRMLGAPEPLLALEYRLISPPLAPVDVIRYLYPKVANGAMRDVRILAYHPSAHGNGGGQEGLVEYRYVALTGGGSVPMEGASLISTTPPRFRVAGADLWTLVVQGAEAPPSAFTRNGPLYLAMFNSIQVNRRGIRERMQTEAENNRIIGQMAQNSANTSAQRTRMIGEAFRNISSMQQQTFDTMSRSNYKIGLGWTETFGQETPVLDTETGSKYVLPNDYIYFFTDRGMDVRAPANAPLGSYEGDVLEPVPAGEW